MPPVPDKGEQKRDDWLKVEISVAEELMDAVTDFLTEMGSQGAFQESPEPQEADGLSAPPPQGPLKALFPCNGDLEQRLFALQTYLDSLAELFPAMERPSFQTEIVRNPDWGEAWKKHFKPFRVSRKLVIKPTWESLTPSDTDIVIEIDPGMAFGTGQHASTRMCLEAIEQILLDNRSSAKQYALDVGTGTGILGIACAKLGVGRVLCVDNDEQAVKIARENVLINRVEDRVAVTGQDIAALTGSFPLILANLTAKILIGLHPCLTRLAGPGGTLVISGIIEQNRSDIEARFLGEGFSLQRLITAQEWVCYILKKEVTAQ